MNYGLKATYNMNYMFNISSSQSVTASNDTEDSVS